MIGRSQTCVNVLSLQTCANNINILSLGECVVWSWSWWCSPFGEILARWVKRRNSTQLNEVLCCLVFSSVVLPCLAFPTSLWCCLLCRIVFSLRPLSCICLVIFSEWLFLSLDLKQGRKPGIYLTWSECEEQIKGLVSSCLISHLSYVVLPCPLFICFVLSLTCLILSCLVSHVSRLVSSWKGCANQYKSFNTKEEAEAYFGLSGPPCDCLVL